MTAPKRLRDPDARAKYLKGDLIILYERIAAIGPGTKAVTAADRMNRDVDVLWREDRQHDPCSWEQVQEHQLSFPGPPA
jgi:hypothetical protein